MLNEDIINLSTLSKILKKLEMNILVTNKKRLDKTPDKLNNIY